MEQDEILALRLGDTFLRKRTNRIVKCQGKQCKESLKDKPIEEPHDVCFLRMELRPKRNKSWKSQDENDFAVSKCHYHVRKKCIGEIDVSKVIISKSIHLSERHYQEFRKNGIFFD